MRRQTFKKINNCIANSKKFFIVETIKTSTKGKEIHISCKANLVNKAKDVKSNFKALEMRRQISRVRIIEFSVYKSKDE